MRSYKKKRVRRTTQEGRATCNTKGDTEGATWRVNDAYNILIPARKFVTR
jgi:hypothetical protein